MASTGQKRKLWFRKQHFARFLAVLLVLLTAEKVGGDITSPWDDGSNVNDNSSLCRVIRKARKNLINSVENNYTVTEDICNISNHCTNVSCSARFTRDKLETGLVLNLCQDDPELQYLVNLPEQWDQPWTHTFSSKNFNGRVQRVEIVGKQNGTSQVSKQTRWFIKVVFSITKGHNRATSNITYISIQSVLQICQNVSEETCSRNTTLLDFPRLPQNQICDFTDTSVNVGSENFPSSSRSSRNANGWNPQNLHNQAAERTRNAQRGVSSSAKPGDPCNFDEIFMCGPGGTCVAGPNGNNNVCACLTGFMINATSHTCITKPPNDPSTADSINSRSYSSAIGAVLSILILVGIAAGIFFGTKYHYFTRLRHRLPVLRCWPFRTNQPWEDNVTMVNPLGPQEDDDPPLL